MRRKNLKNVSFVKFQSSDFFCLKVWRKFGQSLLRIHHLQSLQQIHDMIFVSFTYYYMLPLCKCTWNISMHGLAYTSCRSTFWVIDILQTSQKIFLVIFVLFKNTLGETKKRSQQLQNLILQYTLYPAKPDKKQGPNSKMHIDNRKCMNKVYT